MTPPNIKFIHPRDDSWDVSDLGEAIVGVQWQLPTVQDLQMGSLGCPSFAKLGYFTRESWVLVVLEDISKSICIYIYIYMGKL